MMDERMVVAYSRSLEEHNGQVMEYARALKFKMELAEANVTKLERRNKKLEALALVVRERRAIDFPLREDLETAITKIDGLEDRIARALAELDKDD